MFFELALLSLLAASLTAIRAFFAASPSLTLTGLRARNYNYGFRHSHLPTSSSHAYQDEDGRADNDNDNDNYHTLAKYTDRIPKTLAFLFITADLLICATRFLGIAGPGLALGHLVLLARVLTAAQIAALFLVPNPTQRFTIGCCAAVSCTIGGSATLYQIYRSASETQNGVDLAAVGDVVFLFLAAASALSLPRRPSLLHHGRSVDEQYTVSALQRYSFAWTHHLLYRAKVEGRLEYDDLPALHRAARTESLLNHFFNVFNHAPWQSLWVKVFLAHKGLFCQQWALTIASSFALYAPQLCMLKILRLLEARRQPEFTVASLWFWVAVLGLSKMVQVAIESWLEWVNWAMLSVPVRSQLAAIIFQKSLRTKDIKGAKATNKGERQVGGAELEEGSLGVENEEEPLLAKQREDNQKIPEDVVKGDEEDPSSGMQQAIINLVGVDTVRISNFAAENNLLLSTIVNLGLALTFLFNLLGWLGVCAGLVMPILLTPLNLWATRKYSDAQDSVMTIRDQRMALVGEALRGIRQIKFSAVEDQWQSMILAVRNRELKQQWWVYILTSGLLCIWMAAPLLFSTVSLAIHAWQRGGISPATAFTSLAIFGTLEYALSVVPNLITEAVDANVSVQRIQKHLQRQERAVPEAVGEHVIFDQATVQWPSDDDHRGSFALRELDLRFPKGELSVICGKTGCGKSLLLASILGESDVIEGSIKLPAPAQVVPDEEWTDPASVAYVAQIPWTENATIRDNILFGLPFVKTRYEQVIWACALERDIEIMPDGEFTEVGANGINLSGGQRWRITFARALYSRAATLLLDDIFSAVDAHVGRHLLQHGLLGSLAAGRTRILATHHEELVLPATSYIVRLTENNGSSYAKTTSQSPQSIDRAVAAFPSPTNGNTSNASSTQTSDTLQKVELGPAMLPKPAKFVEKEVRERGHIKWQIYKAYMIAAGGFPFWTTALGVFALAQGTLLGRAWLVKVWTEKDARGSPNLDARQANAADPAPDNDLYFFLGGYLIVSLLAAALAGVKFIFFCRGSIEASGRLFESFTETILRAPLRWLDTVPQGRILNRFAADFSSVDAKLARDVSHFWESGLAFLAIVIASMIVSVYMLLPSLLLGVICFYYTAQYLPGAREIKRLEATAQSPVFEHYSSTLTGLITIRCFQKAAEYQTRMHDYLDEYARSTWHLWLTQRWMSFRMGMIGAVFAFAVAAVVATRSDIDAALAGFALSFSLQYSEAVVEMIRRYSAMELDMNSTERIVEYTNMPTEDRSGVEPPPGWPSRGRIQVEELEAAYAPGLPSVLQGLTFEIEPGQRIGLVGRTGSGKSSLTLALFRFIEARSGRILIDGTDIAKIRLQALRSRLSIIPQDPVLFSGTLRTNLDVFNQYDDEVLLQSLRHVHLLETPETGKAATKMVDDDTKRQNIFESLESPISEGGLSLSQGQRQLVCLARAIVTRPQIMVLDEATSAVDMGTDALIQESIRKQFQGSTLIVIAHRLSTIADFDKILVLDNGRAVEFDAPRKLLEKPDGMFRRMLNESGEKEKLERLVYKS